MATEPVNEYGCPLHACAGHTHDAHYWAWIRGRCLRGDFGRQVQEWARATQELQSA